MVRYGRTLCTQQGDDYKGCKICEGEVLGNMWTYGGECPFVDDRFNAEVTHDVLHLMSPEEKMCDMRARMKGSD